MSDETLVCQWCGDYVNTEENVSVRTGEMAYRWLCVVCEACGPWRATRDEAIATLRDVRPESVSDQRELEYVAMARLVADDKERRQRAEAALEELRLAVRAFADHDFVVFDRLQGTDRYAVVETHVSFSSATCGPTAVEALVAWYRAEMAKVAK
jgi:hypothetical protein